MRVQELWADFLLRAPGQFDDWMEWGFEQGTDVVKAIAKTLMALDVEIKKPKLGRYEGPLGKPAVRVVGGQTDAAHYDRTTHVITVRAGSTEDATWGALLWEVYNASGRERLKTAQSDGKERSVVPPMTVGRRVSDAEFETFLLYIAALQAMETTFGRPALPEQGRKALDEWDRSYHGNGKLHQQDTFAATVHRQGAPADDTESLPTADMYAYEAVESWASFAGPESRIVAALRATRLDAQDLFEKVLGPAYSRLWPDGHHDGPLRPLVYISIIEDLVPVLNAVATTCPAVEGYGGFSKGVAALQGMTLSAACKALAQVRYQGPPRDIATALSRPALRNYLIDNWAKGALRSNYIKSNQLEPMQRELEQVAL